MTCVIPRFMHIPIAPHMDGNGTHRSATKQRAATGKPFVKGDPRINRGGRPKCFTEFRDLAQKIAHEVLAAPNGQKLTVADAILRSWAKSKEPQLQKAFIEYAFGKVPDKVEATGLENKTTLILHYADEPPNE
jgi:hypothetical protein